MKKSVFLGIIFAFILSGCEKSPSASTAKQTKNEDGVIPHNSYNDGGGLDGSFKFKWTSENDKICNDTDSYNEVCAEFVRQMNEYNPYVANSRK